MHPCTVYECTQLVIYVGHLGLVMLGQDYSGQESAFLVDLRRELGNRFEGVSG